MLLLPVAARAFPELCNGIDDDGDGLADEGPVAWYLDADGDTAGDPAVLLWSLDCGSPPPGAVLNSLDCNDDSAVSYIGAPERSVADGLDNDCDGDIDEQATPGSTACASPLTFSDADSQFLGCRASLPWSSAQAECALMGYHLATIDDPVENELIRSHLPYESLLFLIQYTYWWVGLHEESAQDNWVWETGPATFFLWNASQPNNAGLDCVLIYGGDGTWSDDACSLSEDFLCEADCIKREAFVDADRDGLGDPSTAVLSCTLPAFHVWNAEDCDDTQPDTTRPVWYVDADGDGIGSTAVASFDCEQPPETSPEPTDCDDTSAFVFPGQPEIPGDGIDQDCDGEDALLEEPGPPPEDPPQEEPPADLPQEDFDRDGFSSPEDCDDADASVHPGAKEDLSPIDRNCDGLSDPTGSFSAACGHAPSSGSFGLTLFAPGLALLALRRRSR